MRFLDVLLRQVTEKSHGFSVFLSRYIYQNSNALRGACMGLLLFVALWLVWLGQSVDLSSMRTPRPLMDHSFSLHLTALCGLVLGFLLGTVWQRRTACHVENLAATEIAETQQNIKQTSDRAEIKYSRKEWVLSASILIVITAIYSAWSGYRHYRFGSGSWDMGCYIHNLWLAAHGKPLVSSVLGDVPFLGDHFMPTLLLGTPLAYIGSTYTLFIVQAILVVGAAYYLHKLCEIRSVPYPLALVVSLVYVLAFGVQNTIYFDVHEVAPVPLCLLWALYSVERGHRKRAVLALFLLAGCKESAWLYAASVALYVAVQAISSMIFPTISSQTARANHPLLRNNHAPALVKWGFAWFLFFVLGFFVVVGKIQPALLAGSRSMLHVSRFAAFGSNMNEAALYVMTHPLVVVLWIFLPLQKLTALLVSFGTFSFLPLLAPTGIFLFGANLLERFLPDKMEMWGLGFHYSLTLTAMLAYQTVVVIGYIYQRTSTKSGFSLPRFVWGFVGLFVVGLLSTYAYAGFPLEKWQQPYFSTRKATLTNQRAIQFLHDLEKNLAGHDANTQLKVVAQNHFLPHLAERQFIWQTEARFVERADVVILNPKESPWPQNTKEIEALVRSLQTNPAWALVFHEDNTVVFIKSSLAQSLQLAVLP